MSETPKPSVLIVDDNEVDGLILKKCLSRDFLVFNCNSGEEALGILSEQDIDVVVLDILLPGISGFDVLKSLRSRHHPCYLGIVVLTASDDKSAIERALDLGADGFGSKVDAVHQVLALVRNALRIKLMTDELSQLNAKLKAANRYLEKQSITDHLTGLFNMRQMGQILEHEYRRALRYQMKLSLIMIDIDHFKQVNDKLDHLMGSFVISEIGKQIKSVIRDLDFGARYGGDEFIIALPETDIRGAFRVASRLRDLVNHTIYDNGTHQTCISISQGISCLEPDETRQNPSLQDLIRVSDLNLYEAKKAGRNNIIMQVSDKPQAVAS